MRSLRRSLLSAGLCVMASFCQAAVTVEQSTVTLPTCPPGPCDKNPIFYTGRVYQGAQGRVYPYPLQDVLHDEKDEKVDKKYTALLLENEYLKMSLLPEVGGRLFSFTDKDTGFEIFYGQSVIKPALIGMLGAWTSGGVEWSFPHHHRATTFVPIDYTLTDNADGSKTVWIGETELRHRMKWSIGLSMRPGRSYLEADCRFMNRQSYIESMLHWANVSVHCGENYQVLFPPSCRVGADRQPGGARGLGALSKFSWNDQRQAKWFLRRTLLDLSLGLELVSYFHLVDLLRYNWKRKPQETPKGAALRTNFRADFGLLRGDDYTPKPSYFACQRVCSLFDRATQPTASRASFAGAGLTVPADSLAQACFRRGTHPLFAYWWPEALQKDVAMQTADILLATEKDWALRCPVLVDLLSGDYYQLNGRQQEAGWLFPALPLADYPLLITDAAVVA